MLVNLGTPLSPAPDDVGNYLKEFLTDPYVIDIPAPLRWFLVHALIVPRRKHASSALYRKVWTPEGSPLLVYSRQLCAKVRDLCRAAYGDAVVVDLGMRYGNPSLDQAMATLMAHKIDRLVVLPLYPQYALSSTETAKARLTELLKARGFAGAVSYLPAFYDHPDYLDAVAEVSAPYLKKPWDKVLFSFHGLPERQVKKTDASGGHCLQKANCCDHIVEANAHCYRAQSYATARGLAQRLGLKPEQYLVGFQSRLGRTPWIKPFSDEYYRQLPNQGVKRLAVLSPSFVADCLETLEEISLRGKEEFCQHGGEDLFLVPSLNDSDVWAKAVVKMVSPLLSPAH